VIGWDLVKAVLPHDSLCIQLERLTGSILARNVVVPGHQGAPWSRE